MDLSGFCRDSSGGERQGRSSPRDGNTLSFSGRSPHGDSIFRIVGLAFRLWNHELSKSCVCLLEAFAMLDVVEFKTA
jgi:hypothetical protein